MFVLTEKRLRHIVKSRLRTIVETSKSKSKLGDCYESAVKHMMKLGGGDFKLVHAEVAGQGPLSGLTYGHAFVLDIENDEVLDNSNGRHIVLPKQFYYKEGHIDEINNIFEYSFEEMCEKLLTFRHYGPWELQTATGL